MTSTAALANAMIREAKAKTAHAVAVAEIRAILKRLDAAAADEQARMASPTWVEVETLRRFASQLREISDQMLCEGEYDAAAC